MYFSYDILLFSFKGCSTYLLSVKINLFCLYLTAMFTLSTKGKNNYLLETLWKLSFHYCMIWFDYTTPEPLLWGSCSFRTVFRSGVEKWGAWGLVEYQFSAIVYRDVPYLTLQKTGYRTTWLQHCMFMPAYCKNICFALSYSPADYDAAPDGATEGRVCPGVGCPVDGAAHGWAHHQQHLGHPGRLPEGASYRLPGKHHRAHDGHLLYILDPGAIRGPGGSSSPDPEPHYSRKCDVSPKPHRRSKSHETVAEILWFGWWLHIPDRPGDDCSGGPSPTLQPQGVAWTGSRAPRGRQLRWPSLQPDVLAHLLLPYDRTDGH